MKSQIATTLATFLLAGTSAAFPAIPDRFQPLRARNDSDAAAAELAEKIALTAPDTTACDLSQHPECRTSAELAPFMLHSLQRYGIGEPGAVAAVVALTAFESDGYRYKHNVSPGRAGQGTSNMQMFPSNLEYARSLPGLAGEVDDIMGETVEADAASPEQKNEVLALLTVDEYNFGSGPWYLRTKCSSEIIAGLARFEDASFASYMTECVGTTMTEGRQALWDSAKAAFRPQPC